MEKLPSEYLVKYGDPQAETKIIEYFSLSCPDCIKCFIHEFKPIQKEFIDTRKASWAFHPNPADLLTLQAMVCLEKLTEKEKITFLETVIETLYGQKVFEAINATSILQITMQALGKPIQNLNELEGIKTTKAYQNARLYLKQPDFVQDIPTVEINGKIYDAFPDTKFIKKHLENLAKQKISKKASL